MPKQNVYGVSRDVVLSAIDRSASRHFGYAFGNSDPASMKQAIASIRAEAERLNLAKVCQVLRSLETQKLPANANKAIDEIIAEINAQRVII
jgi:hypothetical protein